MTIVGFLTVVAAMGIACLIVPTAVEVNRRARRLHPTSAHGAMISLLMIELAVGIFAGSLVLALTK